MRTRFRNSPTRTADGYTEITPPRQQGQQTPKKTVVYYDDNDHPMDTVDLLGHHSRASYNRQDQLDWTENRLDAPTDYSYDPVTHGLLSKTDPDPDGNGAQTRPVTSYRYDEQTIGTATAPGGLVHGLHAAYYANTNLSGRATKLTLEYTETVRPPSIWSRTSEGPFNFEGEIGGERCRVSATAWSRSSPS